MIGSSYYSSSSTQLRTEGKDKPRLLLLRGREVESRQPHKLKIGGSNPSPATNLLCIMTLDQFNSLFPIVASIAVMMNIRRLYRDKIVKGIHPFSPLIGYTGQISGTILLYSLGQYYSAAAGVWYTLLSFTWYSMMIYYNFIKKND